jgi:hypothetical protein
MRDTCWLVVAQDLTDPTIAAYLTKAGITNDPAKAVRFKQYYEALLEADRLTTEDQIVPWFPIKHEFERTKSPNWILMGLVEIIFAIALVLLGYVVARNLSKHGASKRTSTFIVMSGIADRNRGFASGKVKTA